MSGKKYVPEGVYLVCDKGAKPSEFKILFYNETFIYGEKIATSADKTLIANFDPFGACACANGSPCTAPVTNWTSVTDGITLNGNDLLLEDSELPCSLGGNIKIFFSLAAATAAVPKPEKNFFEKMFDALPEGPFKTYVDFEIGVAQGLWKGLKGTVTGIVDLVVWSGKHTLPYIILNPQGFKEQLEKDEKTLKAIGNVAEKAGTWAYRNSAVNMLNDPDDFMAAQYENGVMAHQLIEKASNMTTREWGDVTGQVFFEVALEVGTAGVASTLTAVKAADRSLDVIKTVNALENASDGIKVLENADDLIDAGRGLENMHAPMPEELGEIIYLVDDIPKKPSDFGISMIADNPELLKIWNDNLKTLVKADTNGGKLFRKYLDNLENGVRMSNDELGEVWDVVRSRFKNQAKKNGVDLPSGDPIHHWNYNKADYPELITNPSNLTEPIPYDLHKEIHQATQSGKTWSSPIKPEHVLPINSSKL